MVALGWGLAHAERQREARLLSRTGGSRWVAAVAHPGCLGISGLPEESTCDVSKGETCLDQKKKKKKAMAGRKQTEVVPGNPLSDYCQHYHRQVVTSPGGSRGSWFPDLSPEPLFFTDAQSFLFLLYILIISLGYIL